MPDALFSARDQRELRAQPLRPLALPQDELLVVQIEARDRLRRVHVHRQIRRGDRVILAQAVGRAVDVQHGAAVLELRRCTMSAARQPAFAFPPDRR